MRYYQQSKQGFGKGGDGEMETDLQYVFVIVWGDNNEQSDFFFLEQLSDWWSHLLKGFKIREKEIQKEKENQGLQFGHTNLEMLNHHLSVDVNQAVGYKNLVITGEFGAEDTHWRATNAWVVFKAIYWKRSPGKERWRISKIEPWIKKRGRRISQKAEKEKKGKKQENVLLKHESRTF